MRLVTIMLLISGFFSFAVVPASANTTEFEISATDTLAHSGGGFYSWPGQDMASDVRPPEPPPAIVVSGSHDEHGSLNIAAEDFRVAPSWVIVSGDMFVGPFPRIDWRAKGPVTGTYSEATGEVSIALDLVQTVTTEGAAPCEVGPVPVTLSTENTGDVGHGRRFTEGLNGPGALVGDWTEVPEPSGEGCDLRAMGCLVRQHLLSGHGGFGLAREHWLDGTVPWQRDKTVDKFGIPGYVDEGGCQERPDPGPTGPTGPTGPDTDPAPDLSVGLQRSSLGKKKASFSLIVTNSGGAASGVEVCGRTLRGPRLKSPGCREIGSLAAGGNYSRRLTVLLSSDRAERRRQLRRGKLKVSVAADDQAALSVTRPLQRKGR